MKIAGGFFGIPRCWEINVPSVQGQILDTSTGLGETHAIQNLFHQLHSLYRLTGLIETADPDVVVFLRPDLRYLDPLPSTLVASALRSPLTRFLPQWQWYRGFNDRLAICGRSAYQAYGRRIMDVHEFCQQTGVPLHPESLLRFLLCLQRIWVRTTPRHSTRIQVDGKEAEGTLSIQKMIGLYRHLFVFIRLWIKARIGRY